MNRCPSPEQLQDLLADRLVGAEAEAIEAHVEACPACQQALERLTGGADTREGQGPASRSASGGDFLRRLENRPPPGLELSPADGEQAKGVKRPDPVARPPLAGAPTAPYEQD